MRKYYKGFLLLSAAALIIVGAIIGLLVSHMVSTDHSATKSDSDSTQAFYIASAGLERVLHAVTTNDLSERVACSSITNHASFTNAALGNGFFTVTGVKSTLSTAFLTTAISSSATIIPVSDLTGYALTGRFAIDDELIDYGAVSTNDSTCAGSAPCFTRIARGVGGTSAAAHVINSKIVQSRCALSSTGSVFSNGVLQGQRVLSADVFQLEQGWLIGNSYNGGENILSWDGGAWVQFANSASIPDVHYHALEMLNYAEGWMLGQPNDGSATLLHYDGNQWARVLPSAGVPSVDLNGIDCVSSNDCWAVGDAATFIHWDGTNWSNVAVAGLPNKAIHSVSCSATNNCWAVGQQHTSSPLFIFWDGSSWAQASVSALPNIDYNDIACIANNDCWAVGGGSSFAHWDGSAWSDILPEADVPNKDIKSISCLSTSDCWAVGSPQGGDSLIVHWNGASWSKVTPAAGVPNSSLHTVDCVNSNNCWAAGNNGTIIHWDGGAWDNGDLGTIPSVTFNSIYVLGSLDNVPLIANWEEQS